MGAVDAQLMSAAGMGIEPEATTTVIEAGDNVVGRQRGAAVDGVNHLTRPVVEVGAQGQTDDALVALGLALDDSHIALLDGVGGELPLQVVVGRHGLGDDHQPTGVHVEAVDDERRRGIGEAAAHEAQHTLAPALAWNGEQSGGFAHHADVGVVVERAQPGG